MPERGVQGGPSRGVRHETSQAQLAFVDFPVNIWWIFDEFNSTSLHIYQEIYLKTIALDFTFYIWRLMFSKKNSLNFFTFDYNGSLTFFFTKK